MSVSRVGHLQRCSHLNVYRKGECLTKDRPFLPEVKLCWSEVKHSPDEFLNSETQTVKRDKSGS